MIHPDEQAATDAPARSPASYRALRMAAEWASALRDQPLSFVYDADTGHMVLGPGGLPVHTISFTTRPKLLDIEFSVPSRTAEIAPPALTVCGDQASALFWGESAVEKFLLSYYASVAADDAPRFLDRLFGAWYGYPAEVVEVCAIACLCGRVPPPPGTPLSLARTVGLICLERGGGLRLLTLDEFDARYATGLPRGGTPVEARGDQVEVRRGWPVTDGVESIVARDVAEFVSGMRGHFIAFSTEASMIAAEVYPGESPALPVEGAFFTGLARPVRPGRPAPCRVALRVQEPDAPDGVVTRHVLIPDASDPGTEFLPDSLFWTDGAVEKLLLPYYASVKGSESPFFNACLMGKWDGRIHPSAHHPTAVARAFRTRLKSIGGHGRTAETEPSTVYAVTHLPRSEYADESGGEDVAARTFLLSVREGTTAVHALWKGQGGAAAPEKSSRNTMSRAT